ncbi:MAG: DR2241 family protein [Chthoniobacterales bacterium]
MATATHRRAVLPVTEAFTFGQVLVVPVAPAGFRLSHRDDRGLSPSSQSFSRPEDALEIGRTDDLGSYRPLKTAPNLRHGWRLDIADVPDLYRALDFLYPGRLAVLHAHQNSRLKVTPLRQTLDRQTGMYRVAGKITDEQLNQLVGNFCRSDGGCLRTILWSRDQSGAEPSTKLPSSKYDPDYDQNTAIPARPSGTGNVPLLCQESCNLLVAQCRNVVKGTRAE